MKLKLGVLVFGLAASGLVAAQTAGTFMIKAGYNEFYPQVRSGDITGVPNGKVNVGNAGNLFGSVAYMLTDNVAAELTLGVPPNHDIYGAGSVAFAGKIASADILPPALSVQYRFFDAKSTFRPFVGVGVVRAMFRNVQGTPALTAMTNPGGATTKISIDNVWGLAAQVGATYAINDKWFVDAAVIPMLIKSTARLSTGQTVDATLNPIAVNLSIGYRF